MGFDGFVVQSKSVFSSPLVKYLISVDSSRVCRFSSFKLVDGVVEFLHRERLQCVFVLLVLVLVFVFVCLRR